MSTQTGWTSLFRARRSAPVVAFAVLTGLAAAAPARAAATPPAHAVAPSGYSARALAAQAESDLAAGHPGSAILGFERARLLAPRSPAISTGLERARTTAALPPVTVTGWQRLERHLSPNEWTWIGLIGLASAAVGLVALAWGVIGRAGLAALLAAGLVLSSVGFVAAVDQSPSPGRAIVVTPDLVARIAPFAEADPAFSAPEGSAVTIERAHGDYLLVAGPEGQGWIPSRGVKTILPAAERRL